ncbi:MAG: hypothetical protein AAGA96_14545 [Verrucomicrobiota bacterium]
MKRNLPIASLFVFISLSVCNLRADTAIFAKNDEPIQELDQHSTDYIRENLIHIFDSSQFHHMEGGQLPVKQQEEIKKEIEKIKSASFIELKLDEPTPIVVEGKKLRLQRLWVSVRESDGFVYDWIIEQSDGTLVSLNRARGELIVQFAPFVLHLLKKESEQDNGGNC